MYVVGTSVSTARDSSEKNRGSKAAVPGIDMPGMLRFSGYTSIQVRDQETKGRMELGNSKDSSERTEVGWLRVLLQPSEKRLHTAIHTHLRRNTARFQYGYAHISPLTYRAPLRKFPRTPTLRCEPPYLDQTWIFAESISPLTPPDLLAEYLGLCFSLFDTSFRLLVTLVQGVLF